MVAQVSPTLSELYETDETAWLEAMVERIALGQLDGLDYAHLQEYLTDMAIRDRREVKSRLTVLLSHLLKWQHQPDQRTGSWSATILLQQSDLEDLAATGVLRKHAEAVLESSFAKAVDVAANETKLPTTTFPPHCPWTIEQLLHDNLLRE